ncbi:RNA 3'-terminal phosphate cyclase RCL1 [Methanonatronarchaeum thermophilum]|uniref:RNA 3'-terminal phosphate cyclase n=1 Tax=Methanonatronarchaeum thermophilum TaxID=1927129 RepID=A0A1Y3GD88_9EURY|nr:RNA 3'-terminal phosphate cyclase [Methanonatronarchaeum thermophilum]OUJ19210.1 RNA 3'-terminal phosphate cyclase RCL1 [Methanonatronarchaeum thermophilum]
MLVIDGSYGEGGGQVVRTALAMSTVLQKPFRLENIRAGRSKPGLSHQHLSCVELMKRLTDARVVGDTLRSTELFFEPKKTPSGEVEIDIGTAGSVSLLIQCVVPTLHVASELKIVAVGGTDVKWAPPIDYLKHVTKPVLSQFGIEFDLDLIKRGYYPKGGGKISLTTRDLTLNSKSIDCKKPQKIKGVSHCGNLPRHIAIRQAQTATKKLKKIGLPTEIEIETCDVLGKGSGIVVWSQNGCRYAGSSLGKPGKPAEKVGEEAAIELIKQIKTEGDIDKYCADQLIPTLSLAGGNYTTTEITMHTKTNAWLVNQFNEKNKIKIHENQKPPKITTQTPTNPKK